jgi:single-stranded DNA-binding protein
VAWEKTAQIIEKYVTKGKEVAIEVKLTNRSYENKEGEKRYVTEVVCNELLMLGNRLKKQGSILESYLYVIDIVITTSIIFSIYRLTNY